jgi:hypothetical protein
MAEALFSADDFLPEPPGVLLGLSLVQRVKAYRSPCMGIFDTDSSDTTPPFCTYLVERYGGYLYGPVKKKERFTPEELAEASLHNGTAVWDGWSDEELNDGTGSKGKKEGHKRKKFDAVTLER